MAIPLIIDKAAKDRIQNVKRYAHENFLDERIMQNIVSEGWAPGDIDGYSCNLDIGFRVVYTVEKHPLGWCRHMSMSLAATDRVPSIHAVDMVLEELSFKGRLAKKDQCLRVYMEDNGAVNVIEAVDMDE